MNPRLLTFKQQLDKPFPLTGASHANLADYVASNQSYWEYHGVRLTAAVRGSQVPGVGLDDNRWWITLEAVQ
jgi:hypothetical protein